MQYRRLGETNLQFSVIGLGTWAIGGNGWQYGWGPQDDEQSIKTIHHALEMGINWIDTAPAYGLGHAEEIIGKALAGLHEKPHIATKCGLIWNNKGKISGKLSRKSIFHEIEESLTRLKTEVIDLYQIHWPMPEKQIEEAWAAMSDLIKEGKIKVAGVSNFSVPLLQKVDRMHPVSSLQPPYSILERTFEKNLLKFCSENNIGVIAYSPLQKGLLTGKMSLERLHQLPSDDHRHYDPMFKEPIFTKILDLVEKLQHFAEQRNKTISQLAISWILRHRAMTSAIVGSRSPEQIEETAKAGDWTLSHQEIDEIDEILYDFPDLAQN